MRIAINITTNTSNSPRPYNTSPNSSSISTSTPQPAYSWLGPYAYSHFSVSNNTSIAIQIIPGDKPRMYGLLLLTGALWGCTNPFIRQGTRGLCKVKGDTRFSQACAELSFLLGNWKYVLPWLVNQVGSVVYLAVVQRVPLSLAVPAANSLAFAFTALTGAAMGTEQPLDSGSILGIVFIGVGTALCCWDKTN